MKSPAQVESILHRVSPSDRVLYFASLLASEAGLGSADAVIVGGSAVEIYTRAAYSSDDIDLVGDRRKLSSVLQQWGFERGHRNVWFHRDWKLTIDLVKSSLSSYTGSFERTKVISTPFGTIRVEAPEDSMVRRLIQARHWSRGNEFEWALAVATANKDSLDWDYAQRLAKLDHVSDLLEEIRKRIGP